MKKELKYKIVTDNKSTYECTLQFGRESENNFVIVTIIAPEIEEDQRFFNELMIQKNGDWTFKRQGFLPNDILDLETELSKYIISTEEIGNTFNSL